MVPPLAFSLRARSRAASVSSMKMPRQWSGVADPGTGSISATSLVMTRSFMVSVVRPGGAPTSLENVSRTNEQEAHY